MRKPGEQPPPGLKLALAAPAIRGEYLKISSEMQEPLAEAIATRTGTDLERDMCPGHVRQPVTGPARHRLRDLLAALRPGQRSSRRPGRQRRSPARPASQDLRLRLYTRNARIRVARDLSSG